VHLTGNDAEVVLSQNGFDLPGVGAVVAGGAKDLPQVGPGSTPDAPEDEARGRQAAVVGGLLPPVWQVNQALASPRTTVPCSSTT
jgi:hypothetical protein